MIKIDESMHYDEFLDIVKDNQCELKLKNDQIVYIDPGDFVSFDTFQQVDMVLILDQKRQSIGDKAKEIIYGDREQTYGDPGVNLRSIAEYWTTYTGVLILPEDVCNMMCLLKIARLCHTPGHEDSMVDLVGYTLLQERIINKC